VLGVIGLFSTVKARVRSLNDLSALQIAALQESEQRLATFDLRLQELDHAHRVGKISFRTYSRKSKELTDLIADEAEFQDCILTKQSDLPEKADKVLATVGKFAVEAPLYLSMVALEALGVSHATITP
jgi:hypothetical protein